MPYLPHQDAAMVPTSTLLLLELHNVKFDSVCTTLQLQISFDGNNDAAQLPMPIARSSRPSTTLCIVWARTRTEEGGVRKREKGAIEVRAKEDEDGGREGE